MCFNEPVSWATLAACWAGCATLVATGRPHLLATGAFLAVVGAMQLWEALLWRNQGWDPSSRAANAAVSRAAMLTNHAEPLALAAACVALLRPRSTARAALALALVVAYAAVFARMSADFLRVPEPRTSSRTGGGLEYEWTLPPGHPPGAYALFLATLVVLAWAYFPAHYAPWAVAAILGTYAASHLVYGGTRPLASLWCFFAALLPWGALLVG